VMVSPAEKGRASPRPGRSVAASPSPTVGGGPSVSSSEPGGLPVLPRGPARLTAGASIPTVFDRKFHAGDYLHHTPSDDTRGRPFGSTASSLLSSTYRDAVDEGRLLAEMESVSLVDPYGRGSYCAMVPAEVWKNLRRFLSRVGRERRA
ncbi:hypothetical protein FOZ63_023953, partial [Perkinsus olseni]